MGHGNCGLLLGACVAVTALFVLLLGSGAATATATATPWSHLFGMSPKVELVSIDVQTADIIESTDPLKYEAQGQGLATIDPVLGIYYIVGTNVSAQTISLVGISLASGNIVSETLLPITLELFVGVGQFCEYDIVNKDVIVVGRDYQAKNQHAMFRVNPHTGNIKTLSKIGDFSKLDLLGGTSVFDPINNIEWFQLPINNSGEIVIRFYGYSAETGTLMNMLDNPYNMANMAFDRTSGLIYGVGLRETPSGQLIRQLVTMNSATGQFEHIADLPPNYVVMMSSIGTLDEENGLFYCFMQKGNSTYHVPKGQSIPVDARIGLQPGLLNSLVVDDSGAEVGDLPFMNLVAIDIKTGKIVSSPKACDQFPDCPWSLQFLNQS